jgi:hypothetical protein
MMLTDYVKLTVTTIDNAWTSGTVCAIIAPGLCMPIILGLPFLEHNNIVMDHNNCSCIDKKTGYNILSPAVIEPPLPPPLPPGPKLHEQARYLKNAKKLALCELLLVCKQCVHDKKLYFEYVKDVDVVASIHDAIESIAFKDRLRKKAEKVKKDFREIFEPIPHIDRLPMDYVARIKLKDGNYLDTLCNHLKLLAQGYTFC